MYVNSWVIPDLTIVDPTSPTWQTSTEKTTISKIVTTTKKSSNGYGHDDLDELPEVDVSSETVTEATRSSKLDFRETQTILPSQYSGSSVPVTEGMRSTAKVTVSTGSSLPVTISTRASVPVTMSTRSSLPVTISTGSSIPVTISTRSSLPVSISTGSSLHLNAVTDRQYTSTPAPYSRDSTTGSMVPGGYEPQPMDIVEPSDQCSSEVTIMCSGLLEAAFSKVTLKSCQRLRTLYFPNLSFLFQCHAMVEPDGYIGMCRKDICLESNHSDYFCEVANEYSSVCSSRGVCLEYREKYNCTVPSCGPGSHYEECGPGCDKDCSDYPCSLPNGPSCHCDEGLVRFVSIPL